MDALHDPSASTTKAHKEAATHASSRGDALPLRDRLMAFAIRKRWVVATGLGILMLVVEIGEYFITSSQGDSAHRLFDVIVYIIMVPAFVLALLGALSHSERELERAKRARGLQDTLSQKLGGASSRQSLAQAILEYTHGLFPGASASLHSYSPRDLGERIEGFYDPDGQLVFPLSDGGSCKAGGILPAASRRPSPGLSRCDLPLTRNGQKVGVLRLEFPEERVPSTAEMRSIKSSLPVIALALDAALLQDLAASEAEASKAERQKIAQNLHDSLAQNISYLRLKLDQLTGENAIHEIGVVLQELERMRASADEAYQQVRSTLDELAASSSEDLASLLESQARAVCSRSGFTLRASRSGTALPLPASSRQHILYITREALHNIEKHAQASLVSLQILWLDQEMILKISDDGVGFDPHIVGESGHYGLWIMQQRAQELGGTLKIAPADEHGTEVTLWVPCHSQRAVEESR